MHNILITIKKELRSIFRDKKTMIAMFIYPILIPFMVFLYGNIGDDVGDSEEEITIGINYNVNKEEETLFNALNIKYIEYKDETALNEAYKNKDIVGYIIAEDENKYTLYSDESSTDGMTASQKMIAYLDSYNNYLAAKYVGEQGLDPTEVFNQITYEYKSLEGNNYMITVLLSVSLTYTILSICIAASNMAISTTATEKENGTLETILTFPIKKGELITGKYASSVIVGFIAALISLILMIISFYIGSKKYTIFKDLNLNINFVSIIGCVLICLMAAIFIAGIAMFLTSFSKSYKEAQSKVGLMNTLGIIPMFVSILGVDINRAYYLIPICNYEQILQELLLSKIDLVNLAITIISTIFYTYIVVTLIIRLYNSEKILFNN